MSVRHGLAQFCENDFEAVVFPSSIPLEDPYANSLAQRGLDAGHE